MDVDLLVARSYQSQLEEIAVNKNTIIHLPTGSGKTFIAARLINRFRHSLKAPWGNGGKRTFFLVNTIPLVDQQKKVIRRLCAVKTVAGYSGEDGIDYWDKNKWDAELSENQVIVMTCQILTDMLTHSYIRIEDIKFGFLKHDFLVGYNINPYKICTREPYYNKKMNQTVLLKFSNKELNCLISTSVIEEGVDIPQCLLVLRYDPPLEYRSYIQSKGRARSSNSSFVVMINEKSGDKYMKQYSTFQHTEGYIQRVLVGNTEDRDAPTQEDIEDLLYNEDDIPPYVTPLGGRLSSVQAISLLNRYCSALPHDQFTTIQPMWIEEKVTRDGLLLKIVKIYLPIACPVKEIISGEPKDRSKTAKRSAALNACITLHKVGELDPLTLLPRHYGVVNFDDAEVRSCFPNWPFHMKENNDLEKVGTKKRVRKHKKVFPAYLQGYLLDTSFTS